MNDSRADILRLTPGESDTAFVAFSSRYARGFDYYRVLERFPASTLLVRDPLDSWYNAGLPGVGSTIDEIAERLRAELDGIGTRRVIAVGSSMGAYAAILFGCLIGADRVVAFSPQTVLDPRLPYYPPAEVELQAPDLEPFVRDSPETKLDVLVGWDDLLDVFYALRIGGRESVRTLAMRRGSHTFVETLGREGLVGQTIEKLVDGYVPDAFRLESPVDPGMRTSITDAVISFHRSEYALAATQIAPLAAAQPDWAGPHFLLGRAHFNASDLAGAEAAFAAAMQANPGWYEPYGHLGRTLVQLHRPAEAEPSLRKAAEMKPDWAWNQLFLGECLLKRGRISEATRSLARAVELDPHLRETVEAITGQRPRHDPGQERVASEG